MSPGLRIAYALALLPSLLVANSAGTTYAQDFATIRQSNENKVVYIQSTRTRKDGTGVPEYKNGTGFIISKQGHVLTAGHVIFDADNDHVVATTGSIRSKHNLAYPLEPVKKDSIDAAVLMLPDLGDDWKVVSMGNSSLVPRDAPLYALGFPDGPTDMLPASGTLSSLYGPKGNWVTTLPINPGHSGGPVFNLNGEVVAIAIAGTDSLQLVTYAIPISYVKGIIQFANATPNDVGALVTGSTPKKDEVSKTFEFYKSVDHEAEENAQQLFCLPDGYRVKQVTPRVTTQNGPGTKLISAVIDATASNCVTVNAFVKGAGVVRIGPIVVDHLGRGWLGVALDVTGVKTP